MLYKKNVCYTPAACPHDGRFNVNKIIFENKTIFENKINKIHSSRLTNCN